MSSSSPSNSSTCTRFVHNAWKKDFCSNCFKSKEEHKALKTSTKPPLKQHQPDATPTKSSIKNGAKKKKYKVSFPKEVSEIIGFGGEWADSDHSSDTDNEDNAATIVRPSEPASPTITLEMVDQDYSKLTKSNTEFNTNINNLITPPVESNIKRSFAALKLGSSSPKEAKKETLKITVLPFTTNNNKSHSKVTEIKQIFGSSSSLNGNGPPSPSANVTGSKKLTVSTSPLLTNNHSHSHSNHKTEIVSTCKISTVVVHSPTVSDKGANNSSTPVYDKAAAHQVMNNSPEIVSVTEKTLLEEISETLEKNKTIELNAKPSAEVVDAVLKKDAIRLEIKNPLNKVLPTQAQSSTATGAQMNENQSSPAGHKRLSTYFYF